MPTKGNFNSNRLAIIYPVYSATNVFNTVTMLLTVPTPQLELVLLDRIRVEAGLDEGIVT